MAFGAAFIGTKQTYRRHGASAEPVTLLIPKGTSTVDMGRLLTKAGVIYSPWTFASAVHFFPGKPLKAGEYRFPGHATLAGVISQMQSDQVLVHRLTIPEGLTNLQIKALVEGEPALSGDIGTLPAEGRLLPESYNFTRNDTRASLIQRMHEAGQKMLAEEWKARDPVVTVTSPEQALTLASIVERETGVSAERAKVASVFYNRMARNIPLQSDPTIIYAMSNRLGVISRPLGHHDLNFDSPYNTYAKTGLPPGPICNPGRASVQAVLHPDKDNYLYFVATGTGGHAFASSLEEHNRNVAQYVKVMDEKERRPTKQP